MFNKKIECLEKSDFVACEECGVMVKRNKAQEIIEAWDFGWAEEKRIFHYYCQAHKRPYDLYDPSCSFHPTKYYKRQSEWKEVDINGRDIKN
jgi:hypothetical protein